MMKESVLLLVCHCRVKLMHEQVGLYQISVTVTEDESPVYGVVLCNQIQSFLQLVLYCTSSSTL